MGVAPRVVGAAQEAHGLLSSHSRMTSDSGAGVPDWSRMVWGRLGWLQAVGVFCQHTAMGEGWMLSDVGQGTSPSLQRNITDLDSG
ncbi:MAG TPA: hypothetical protein VK901_00315 [Nitrospiraceae bacterium]|nr:hypothetical protein [Nitrospiraceae bacterium]